MLARENYTAEHILELRTKTGADPSILERTVFAFGLLEAIRSVGMPFIFKVGNTVPIFTQPFIRRYKPVFQRYFLACNMFLYVTF